MNNGQSHRKLVRRHQDDKIQIHHLYNEPNNIVFVWETKVEDVNKLTAKFYDLLRSHLLKQNAEKIGICGSYARKEQSTGSDLDILVSFSDRKSLLDLVRIERELSELIGVKVDLLTENSISPLIRNRIKQEEQIIYERQKRRSNLS